MEIAFATLALLPGIASVSLATGPRCRAIAPRDVPAVLAAILAFTALNLGLAALLCKFVWGAPSLGTMVAVLITGETHDNTTRGDVIEALCSFRWQNVLGLSFIGLTSWLTGWSAAGLYSRLLRIFALEDAANLGIADPRTRLGRCFDKLLMRLGVHHVAINRGASYWLVVQELARLHSAGAIEVYADITQEPDATLFSGQVVQVIASPSGETHSIVLKKARRYRRTVYGEPGPDGKREILKGGGWVEIGDSEAFYMRGENVYNISYRIYGDPARGGYVKKKGTWIDSDVLEALKGAIRTVVERSKK